LKEPAKPEKANSTELLINKRLDMKYLMAFDGMLVGIAAGLIAVFYRFVLNFSENNIMRVIAITKGHPLYMIAWICILIILALLVGRLVKYEGFISGSGIPQVEGELQGYFKQPWLRVLVAKLVGGSLGILGGLSLGREGPSVQLGAMSGKGITRLLKRNQLEERYLLTCGASAGLAAAFNAPIAGVLFALEEVHKNFSATVLFSATTASVAAVMVSGFIQGTDPVLSLVVSQALPLKYYWLLPFLGIIIGILGAFYNWFLAKSQDLYEKATWLKTEYRPLIPFLMSGFLGFTFPEVLGGGHFMMITLIKDKPGLAIILFLFCLKLLFSMVSFASGTPGGIFFPLLILGAYIGGAFGNAVVLMFGFDPDLINNFIVLAMAGYFTAIIRAPLTGIVLICEMTGSFDHLLSLAFVCICAEITAEFLKSDPVYEMLLERWIKKRGTRDPQMSAAKILISVPAQLGSKVDGALVKDVDWPEYCLLVALRRGGTEIIPHGNTMIMPTDIIVALVSETNQFYIQDELQSLCSESQERYR